MSAQSRTYEITFTGRAGPTLCAAFDDCTIIVGQDTTTMRAQLPDQAALWGILQRLIGLGLELVELHLTRSEPRGHAAPDAAGRRPGHTVA